MVQRRFRKASESIASYDYFDFASGFGYRRLYLSTTETNAGISYILTPNQIISTHGDTDIGPADDKDFDISFASPQVIKGDVILRFLEQSASGSATITATWTLYHVNSAGVETSLGSVTTPGVSVGTNGAVYVIVTKINVTATSFAVGDKLRLNCTTVGTSPGHIIIDPTGFTSYVEEDTNRTVTGEAFLEVPFVIDL